VRSHFLHMLLYSTLVSTFMGVLVRRSRRDRLRLAAMLWAAMVGGALVLAYLMYPFPD
jgi:amino acid permease